MAKLSDFPESLATSRTPFLIGVRHHSVACALAMPALLDAACPTRIYLEMATELQPWIEWVAHEDTVAPIALASVADETMLSFFPLATFSPERVVIEWAKNNDVEVIAFDTSASPVAGDEAAREPSPIDLGRLWDRLVESRVGSEPEDVRRAALRVGWALRRSIGASRSDLCRETHMRAILSKAREGAVAVVGAFHAAALLDSPLEFQPVEAAPLEAEPVTSLVPYDHRLLDERSGYPAGIRDPGWHASVFEGLGEGASVGSILQEQATQIVRMARELGQPGATATAFEIVRLAMGLAQLRSMPHPTRAELCEAARSAMAMGGVAFDRTLEAALVGSRVGRVAKDAPRSGLVQHFESELGALRLPGRDSMKKKGQTKELRLDVLRSGLDRRRHLGLMRAHVAGVQYGEPRATEAAGGIRALNTVWRVSWTPATDASLAFAGRYGVTLASAASGTLRHRATMATTEDALYAEPRLRLLQSAFGAGLVPLGVEWLKQWSRKWALDADLPALVSYIGWLGQLLGGHEAGFDPEQHDEVVTRCQVERDGAFTHAEQLVVGLAGSDRLEDAFALVGLVRLGLEAAASGGRLQVYLRRLIERGHPLMAGAACGASVLAGYAEVEPTGRWVASWIDRATDASGRDALADGLSGLLAGAGFLLEVAPPLLDGIAGRIEAVSDKAFLQRLPALRRGFGVLSKAARRRFVTLLEDRATIDAHALERVPVDPESLAHYAQLDHAAFATVGAALGGRLPAFEDQTHAHERGKEQGQGQGQGQGHDDRRLGPGDRWRLILGQQREALSKDAAGIGVMLEGLGGGQGADDSPSSPELRARIGELEALFGVDVCQEIIADEAKRNPDLITELDPHKTRPSVELLTEILNLAQGMSNADLVRIRPLVAKIIADLTRDLANQVAPALRGVRSARPTRRVTSRLDVPRTIARNLHTARRDDAGEIFLVPDRAIFRAAERRRLTWEVFILLDVSGSMEPSVVHTALMAGILAGVPWVNLQLYAFSTEVVDLSEYVGDPLELLLNVSVGGGTDIGGAVRFVEERIRVPRRSMVIVVSDFEEFGGGAALLRSVERIREAGVRVLGIASLDERGEARFNAPMARRLKGIGMPVAALSPSALARWMKVQVE